MKAILYLLLSTLLISALAQSSTNIDALDACTETSSSFANAQSATDLVKKITAAIIQNSAVKDSLLATPYDMEKAKEKLVKCTEVLMKHNQYKVLETFISDVLDPLDLDLSQDIRMIGNQIKKEIDTLVNLAHAKRTAQIITPAFQWVQSKSNILLQVKFAHRHDAPGCLEVKNDKIEFTKEGLVFSAFGVQGMQPMQFKLNLNFFKDINPEESSWKLESVGRAFVNITKAEPEVWVYLLKENEKLPQMRIWWEMKDTYKEDMREYDRLLEDQEDIDKSKKKKKKSKKTDESQANSEPATSEPGSPVSEKVDQDEL